MLRVLKPCKKELDDFSEDVKGNLADAIARLEEGHQLALPLSRPMPSIGRGVHELRFRDRSGIYRVIYFLAERGSIWPLHAFTKKTQKTPQQNIDVARRRLKEVAT